jgi:hypothetical protein
MKNQTLAVAILLLAAGSAGAQTVWRCGSYYSQKPCAEGVAVQTDDARSAAQASEAGAAARRDARTAAAMEKSRLALEAKASPAAIIGLPAAKTQRTAADEGPRKKKRGKKKAEANPDLFTAVTPGSEKKKLAKK